jgi:hypothetical protein
LPRFVDKRLHFLFGNAAAVRQKFEPITGLSNLLQAAPIFEMNSAFGSGHNRGSAYQGNGLHFESCIQVKSPGYFEQ